MDFIQTVFSNRIEFVRGGGHFYCHVPSHHTRSRFNEWCTQRFSWNDFIFHDLTSASQQLIWPFNWVTSLFIDRFSKSGGWLIMPFPFIHLETKTLNMDSVRSETTWLSYFRELSCGLRAGRSGWDFPSKTRMTQGGEMGTRPANDLRMCSFWKCHCHRGKKENSRGKKFQKCSQEKVYFLLLFDSFGLLNCYLKEGYNLFCKSFCQFCINYMWLIKTLNGLNESLSLIFIIFCENIPPKTVRIVHKKSDWRSQKMIYCLFNVTSFESDESEDLRAI